jgi:hypothetical protein
MDDHGAATPAFFDASGRQVIDQAAHQAARIHPGIGTATACLELHGIGQGGAVVFKIEVKVNPNSYPFLILGGKIGGDICNVLTTQWVVTGGSLGSNLVIEAKRVRPSNAPPEAALAASQGNCATTLSVVGFFHAPNSYAGTYGTNGSNSDFSHTTLFKGWDACA